MNACELHFAGTTLFENNSYARYTRVEGGVVVIIEPRPHTKELARSDFVDVACAPQRLHGGAVGAPQEGIYIPVNETPLHTMMLADDSAEKNWHIIIASLAIPFAKKGCAASTY